MSTPGNLTIAHGTTFEGEVRGGDLVEIYGEIQGSIATRRLLVGETGKFNGSLNVDSAEIHGSVRGDVAVRNLLEIGKSGDVEGDIEYGQLAIEGGANLVANLRNIPPELAGDFELNVSRGGHVVITTEDLHATDADDPASALTFTATNVLNGHLARIEVPQDAISEFTQADINAGSVIFVHNGREAINAGFDVTVKDEAGAAAGSARPVLVRVE